MIDYNYFFNYSFLIVRLQEEQSQSHHLTSSSGRVLLETAGKFTSSASVQTEDSLLQSVVKVDDGKNDDVLSKVGAAVEAMQRNVFELEKQIATLNELHNKKVSVDISYGF